jgi:hypothetical protein
MDCHPMNTQSYIDHSDYSNISIFHPSAIHSHIEYEVSGWAILIPSVFHLCRPNPQTLTLNIHSRFDYSDYSGATILIIGHPDLHIFTVSIWSILQKFCTSICNHVSLINSVTYWILHLSFGYSDYSGTPISCPPDLQTNRLYIPSMLHPLQ